MSVLCSGSFALTKAVMVLFILFLNTLIMCYHQVDTDAHTLVKRMDLESCIGRFDVKLDMIIRTEESRSMGAKFLDHADLGSREECLRLCCETDECDVFVFEEKNEGTCFLFECGPAQNFRCKFTHHANYTSAVLTPMRKVDPPLPAHSKQPTVPVAVAQQPPPVKSSAALGLSQHEMELSNLKEKPSRGDTVPSTLIPPLGVRPGIGVTTTKAPRTHMQQLCSRFQFQCHSGECIAVYNACDGIPQCVDGSDEGPECPVNAVITPKTHIVDVNIPVVDVRDGNNIMQQQQPQRNIIVPLQKPVQRPSAYAAGQQQQQQQQQLQQHNREDPMTAPEWPPLQETDQQLYNTDSHIFNHKGGLQLPGNTNSIAQQYISNNGYAIQQQQQQRDSYMQPMQDVYRMPVWPEPRMPQWPQQQAMAPPSADNNPQQLTSVQQQQQQQQDLAEQQLQRPDWPVRPLQPVIGNANPNAPNSIAKPAEPFAETAAKATANSHSKSSEYDEDSSAGGSDDEEDVDEILATVPPPQHKKKQRKHKKDKVEHHKHDEHDRPVHEQMKNIKNGLEMEFMDHDGAAERPGGAVLSLTLGIIVTAALAVLVGCRANVVRRRTRRGGKSTYAHDADFLVNGMYL